MIQLRHFISINWIYYSITHKKISNESTKFKKDIQFSNYRSNKIRTLLCARLIHNDFGKYFLLLFFLSNVCTNLLVSKV